MKENTGKRNISMQTKVFNLNEIAKLQKDWEALEVGLDMTYFQSYAWNRMLADRNLNVKDKRFTIVYVVVYEEGKAKAIAPLWIVRKTFGGYNRRGAYFFEAGQWSDYLNFIYNEFDANAIDFLFHEIKRLFNLNVFRFSDLPGHSSLCEHIQSNYLIKEIRQSICVALDRPDSVEEYYKELGKNTRQNLRTAMNRARKDGVEFMFEFDEREIDLNEFKRLRNIRVTRKNDWRGKSLMQLTRSFISKYILRWHHYKFNRYTPFEDDSSSRFLTLTTKEGELCAAFNYGIDTAHDRVVMMAVATNDKFSRYSPGMLLIEEFIKESINKKKYKIIDFTRGNERYKYSMGGKEHFNVTIDFSIPDKA